MDAVYLSDDGVDRLYTEIKDCLPILNRDAVYLSDDGVDRLYTEIKDCLPIAGVTAGQGQTEQGRCVPELWS
jgi:hypothetical protein